MCRISESDQTRNAVAVALGRSVCASGVVGVLVKNLELGGRAEVLKTKHSGASV